MCLNKNLPFAIVVIPCENRIMSVLVAINKLTWPTDTKGKRQAYAARLLYAQTCYQRALFWATSLDTHSHLWAIFALLIVVQCCNILFYFLRHPFHLDFRQSSADQYTNSAFAVYTHSPRGKNDNNRQVDVWQQIFGCKQTMRRTKKMMGKNLVVFLLSLALELGSTLTENGFMMIDKARMQ